MKTLPKIIGGTVFGLVFLTGAARAELVLSGSTAGYFQNASSGYNVVTNAPDGSFASFRTGVPVDDTTFQSGVTFSGMDFSNIHNGDSFAFGALTYYNGRTQIGSSSATADLDFYLDLGENNPGGTPFKLTTISFGIDATVNDGMPVPDLFTASFVQPHSILIGDQRVKFTINDLPGSTEVSEDTWVHLSNVTVTFTPVPEPATYGLVASAALVGLATYRRFRAAKVSGPAIA